MKAFFKDLFAYHYHFNQLLAKQLNLHENDLPRRSIPLFSHCINAHQIWNARILEKEKLGVHQVHALAECMRIDTENYQFTLAILEERALDEIIKYENSQGKPFTNSIMDILFHIANHFSHHKGQIISDLRQSGIAPPVTDYIFYKRITES